MGKGVWHTPKGHPFVDCGKIIKPWSFFPGRSPQAVHTVLLNHFQDKDIVEIGTRSGDGISCFAQVAKSVVAIEASYENCLWLHLRSQILSFQGLGSFKVRCGYFPTQFQDADVFTWWQDPTNSPGFSDINLLRFLKRLQEERLIRKTAQAMIIFSCMQVFDRLSWERLHSLMS